MKNCLKTRLKEDVLNDNLKYLGGIVVQLLPNADSPENYCFLQVLSASGQKTKLKVLSGDVYKDAALTQLITSEIESGTNPSNDVLMVYTPKNTEGATVLVENKENITYYNPGNSRCNIQIVDIFDFMCPKLTNLELAFANLSGSGRLEDAIEKWSFMFETSDFIRELYRFNFRIRSTNEWTFNNTNIVMKNWLFDYNKDTKIATIYRQDSDIPYSNPDPSSIIATYNLNTDTWVYNN